MSMAVETREQTENGGFRPDSCASIILKMLFGHEHAETQQCA